MDGGCGVNRPVVELKGGPVADLLVVGPAFFEAFVPDGVAPVPGTEQFVDSIGLGLGGALNSASVAAALGTRTAYMYPRTTWIVDGAVNELCRRAGIHAIPWGDGVEPYVTLVWTNPEDRAFISSADWSPFASCPPFPAARRIHIGGLSEFHLLESRIMEARAAGIPVSTCAGWNPPVLDRLAAEKRCLLDVIFLNQDEATHVCGGVDAALQMLPGRAARNVVVTEGADGAVASFDGRIFRASAPHADVVDPTGAGDAFAAAFISQMVAAGNGAVEFDPCAALSAACLVASRVVEIRGGVVTDPRQVTSR